MAKGGVAAETVENLREQGRSVLRAIDKTVKDRINASRHVFLEQPRGSQSHDEPEMKKVKRLLEEGKLTKIHVDGCVVGHYDAESKLPHGKPSYYLTSVIAASSVFNNCKCDGSHRHEVLEGGPRTAQASVWPQQLNSLVLLTVIEQAEIEKRALKNVQEASPAGQRDQPRRPRRQRRMLTNMPLLQFTSVHPNLISHNSKTEKKMSRLLKKEPLGDHELRVRVAAGLDPILSKPEAQRRQEWLQVDPDLRKVLRTLHVNFGHPTSSTLMRILRRQNARPEAIRAAAVMSCDTCGESVTRRRPKPVRLPGRYVFNDLFLLVFYIRDVASAQFSFFTNQSTGFQVSLVWARPKDLQPLVQSSDTS